MEHHRETKRIRKKKNLKCEAAEDGDIRRAEKEEEKEKEELALDVERLKLGPSKLWTGLVAHHKDVFVSHVLSKLNTTDRWFFAKANTESQDVLEYAGVNVSGLDWGVHECSSISMLKWMWNNHLWGEKDDRGRVMDQAYFCVKSLQRTSSSFSSGREK